MVRVCNRTISIERSEVERFPIRKSEQLPEETVNSL